MANWEETVMSKEQQWEISTGNSDWLPEDIWDAECKAQAKITWDIAFKAGQESNKLAGMQEIAQWVKAHIKMSDYVYITVPELNNQLKVWFKDHPEILERLGVKDGS